MRLIELEAASDEALPVEEFWAHLRLGTGFGDEEAQEGLLRSYLRTALSAIEGRTGKVLLERPHRLELAYFRDPACVPLPLAPVSAVTAVSVQGAEGPVVALSSGRWRLEPDLQRPKLRAKGLSLPAVPEGGKAVIDFTAGFGAWADVPADLRQAVLMLAAQYHEFRHEGVGALGAMPFGVAALIERWRAVRVLAGGA